MDEESTAHSPGDCLTIFLLTGCDAVQYSEKGETETAGNNGIVPSSERSV